MYEVLDGPVQELGIFRVRLKLDGLLVRRVYMIMVSSRKRLRGQCANRDVPNIVDLFEDDGVSFLTPLRPTEVTKLHNLDPAEPPLPQVIVHLGGGHLYSTMLKERLRASSQMHLLEPFVSPDPRLNKSGHVPQDKVGHVCKPFHSSP